MMSMHRLTAGAGYQYLLRHTATGDTDRTGPDRLAGYYAQSGNPPGRWLGSGLAGLACGDDPIQEGTIVTEESMALLFGQGRDPSTGEPLGRAYPSFTSAADRITTAIARLPATMGVLERDTAVETIRRVELAKPTRAAVAGFDLAFTVPKSASVLWALADEPTRTAVLAAHRAAVAQSLELLTSIALFTRVGTRSCAQVATRGPIAAAFDHWDTRTGDPNLHTHLVLANKVQGLDGLWRSVDSRALHHAVVAISEVYDNLLADELARRLPVAWGWRTRGPRRSPAFELAGIPDPLLAVFSTRSTQIDAAMTAAVGDFVEAHGRGPNRVEIVRLRQRVTRATRPDKHVRPLADLISAWRRRSTDATGRTPEELVAAAILTSHERPLVAAQVSATVVDRLASAALDEVLTRRSTWTRANLLAEAARVTRGLRMASPEDRHALHDRVVGAALDRCVSLAAPEVFAVGPEYRRGDGTSVFDRPGEHRFTDHRILDAEARLMAAIDDADAPVAYLSQVATVTERPLSRPRGRPSASLAPDQAGAVRAIATSGNRVDVLVGPAGTGKTTTLLALARAWSATHGAGSVIGLAPSATAAAELADALGIGCENTAKWLHESTGPGRARRAERAAALTAERAQVNAHHHVGRARALDNQLAALHRADADWSLHPGQLLIVDEASLAGTLPLDVLVAQASGAGSKVLLVGDHAQLSAVDAGGAFHLLAERGRPVVLSSLWRFSQSWEADATRQLRTGRPASIDAYAEHDRISAGPHEAMLEDAYTQWQQSEADGHSAILLAADGRSVHALNERAHADRVADGLVAPDGVATAAGDTIARGDRILTRANARNLTTPDGGHVRNGEIWDVLATHPDGSITVTRAGRDRRGQRLTVTLPSDYVAHDVDLGYATTTHRAQGVTVDHAHVLAASGMTRENLYVAMTRGRHLNRVYVTLDTVDALCDGLPDQHRAASARDILDRILDTRGAELSATQTIQQALADAESVERLEPIRATLLADVASRRWRGALVECGLGEGEADAVWAAAARGELVATLRRGEAAGFAMRDVLAAAVRGQRGKAGDELAASLANGLGGWLDRHSEDRGAPEGMPGWRESVPAGDPAAGTLRQVEAVLSRKQPGLTDAAQDGWLRPCPIEGGDEPEPATAQPAHAWTPQPLAERDNDVPTHRIESGPSR
ncbi:MAG: relaxase domain-containing protein [Actinomycetales bacterium]|nr:relaxase domain-containing protein [Actinomycetales bacterium]